MNCSQDSPLFILCVCRNLPTCSTLFPVTLCFWCLLMMAWTQSHWPQNNISDLCFDVRHHSLSKRFLRLKIIPITSGILGIFMAYWWSAELRTGCYCESVNKWELKIIVCKYTSITQGNSTEHKQSRRFLECVGDRFLM